MDQITLSLLVSFAMGLLRWAWAEFQKDKDQRKTKLAIAAAVIGAGFFIWMLFFRTMDTVAGAAVYVLARRSFTRFRH